MASIYTGRKINHLLCSVRCPQRICSGIRLRTADATAGLSPHKNYPRDEGLRIIQGIRRVFLPMSLIGSGVVFGCLWKSCPDADLEGIQSAFPVGFPTDTGSSLVPSRSYSVDHSGFPDVPGLIRIESTALLLLLLPAACLHYNIKRVKGSPIVSVHSEIILNKSANSNGYDSIAVRPPGPAF